MKLKITGTKNEANNYFSLILEKPVNFSFYPGQYIDIELSVNGQVKSDRLFTISSSPTENFLMITTKKGFTDFKEAMVALQIGDSISTSYPIGTFTLDESQPAVFMTGGIGITPFRSIVKYVVDQKLSTKITLIYSNSDNNFLFKKELEDWQKQLPNLTIYYIVTSQVGRLDKDKFLNLYPKLFTLSPKNASSQASLIFYLAGSPKMVDDFASILLELEVDETNIRYDRFDGYGY